MKVLSFSSVSQLYQPHHNCFIFYSFVRKKTKARRKLPFCVIVLWLWVNSILVHSMKIELFFSGVFLLLQMEAFCSALISFIVSSCFYSFCSFLVILFGGFWCAEYSFNQSLWRIEVVLRFIFLFWELKLMLLCYYLYGKIESKSITTLYEV